MIEKSDSTESDVEERYENDPHDRYRQKEIYKKNYNWLVYPKDRWIQIWDFMILVLLLVFAVSFPYQLGVSHGYYVSRSVQWFSFFLIIDCIFFIDTFLHFFRVYRNNAGKLIINKSKIRRSYLRTNFLPNLLSSATFPSVTLRHLLGTSEETNSFTIISRRRTVLFLLFYALRFLRLSNAISLLRSSSIFRRILEHESCKPYRLDLFKYIFFLTMISHWFACLWCGVVFYQALSFGDEILYEDNWMSHWVNATYHTKLKSTDLNPIGWERDTDRYILALFWAIQTLTSIGYGNILPRTKVEWWVSCFCMVICAVCWALTIGSLMNVVLYLLSLKFPLSKLHEANKMTKDFCRQGGKTMTKSDEILRDEISARIRKYILDKRERKSSLGNCITTLGTEYSVFGSLSRELQQMSAYLILKPHLEKVSYLSSKFLSVKEQSLVLYHSQFHSFGSGESVYFDTPSSNFERGVAILLEGFGLKACRKGVPHSFESIKVGKVFGYEEVLLENIEKHDTTKVVFPTYTKILFIPRNIVLESLARNPDAWKNCARWKYLRYLLFTKFARQGLPKSRQEDLDRSNSVRVTENSIFA